MLHTLPQLRENWFCFFKEQLPLSNIYLSAAGVEVGASSAMIRQVYKHTYFHKYIYIYICICIYISYSDYLPHLVFSFLWSLSVYTLSLSLSPFPPVPAHSDQPRHYDARAIFRCQNERQGPSLAVAGYMPANQGALRNSTKHNPPTTLGVIGVCFFLLFPSSISCCSVL